VEDIVAEKKKPSKARFSAEAEVVGGVNAKTGEPFETTSGDSHLYRTVDGKRKYMGFSLPDAKAEEYASELQRETRGMKKGGKVKSASSRADGIAQRGKTRGMMK
jgi:hypothetical protein